MDFVLREIRRVYVYIDNVVISVQSHEENLEKLKYLTEFDYTISKLNQTNVRSELHKSFT